MKNVKLTILYDGTKFNGWQRQTNVKSIQGEIEKALGKTMKQEIKIHGSGRTDAGVHALGQVASFKADFTIPTDRIPIAINTILPPEIVIKSAEEINMDFHARYSARQKRYKYKIYNNEIRNPLYINYSYFVPYTIDVDKMIEATKFFIGEHDFRAFMSKGSNKEITLRTINSIDIYKEEDYIILDFLGNGFLYNMVRIITGTLLDVNFGKKDIKDLRNIILSKERRCAGHKAPAQGLYLYEVKY